MTNEEAIKELQSMCDHLHAHGICDKDSKMLTACKMAISALEQMPEVTSTMQTGQFDYVRQPCEDAVSREDALKSLIENTDFEGWELSQALEAIEKLPSVMHKSGKWIPVSERLPENAKHKGAFCPKYYVMTEFGQTEGWYNPDVGCWYVLLWFMDARFETWNISLERGDVPKLVKNVPVTAWMQLPPSYQGE